jgi:chromosome segregation ATPase
MNYLIWQILTCLLVAALFGLALGWLIWGLLARRLRGNLLEHELKISKLNELPAQMSELQAKHSSLVAEKEAAAAKYALQTADLKRELSGKDSELDQLRMNTFESDAAQRTEHLRKDAVAATLTGRVAELEPLVAQTAEAHARCQDELAIRDAKIAELERKLNELTIQHSAALTASEEMPSPVARLHSHDSQTVEIEELEARLQKATYEREALAERLKELEAVSLRADKPKATKEADVAFGTLGKNGVSAEALASRVAELEPLAARVPALEAEVAKHVEEHAAKDAHIGVLAGKLSEMEAVAASVSELKAAHGLSLSRISELEPVAARVPELEATLSAKDAALAQHAAAHTAKDAHIETLVGRISELEPIAIRV